jgi:hypothetical protein
MMRTSSGCIGSKWAIQLPVCLAAVCLTSVVSAVQGPGLSSEAAKAAAAARGRAMKIVAMVAPPKIIAVRVRHDMCPFCKGFDPQFPTMVRKTKKESVLFVTLDMTNETTQRQAAMLVAALGSESVWTGDLSNMGTIIFVDGKTKQIISTEYQVDQETVLATLREAMALSR